MSGGQPALFCHHLLQSYP